MENIIFTTFNEMVDRKNRYDLVGKYFQSNKKNDNSLRKIIFYRFFKFIRKLGKQLSSLSTGVFIM